MELNEQQAKALKKWLDYTDAEEECLHYYDSVPCEKHIWISIRLLYALVYGQDKLEELENDVKLRRNAW